MAQSQKPHSEQPQPARMEQSTSESTQATMSANNQYPVSPATTQFSPHSAPTDTQAWASRRDAPMNPTVDSAGSSPKGERRQNGFN
jgi:hypothetical protein